MGMLAYSYTTNSWECPEGNRQRKLLLIASLTTLVSIESTQPRAMSAWPSSFVNQSRIMTSNSIETIFLVNWPDLKDLQQFYRKIFLNLGANFVRAQKIVMMMVTQLGSGLKSSRLSPAHPVLSHLKRALVTIAILCHSLSSAMWRAVVKSSAYVLMAFVKMIMKRSINVMVVNVIRYYQTSFIKDFFF